jgi:nucleoside-diphosphate-sugar epimerase
VVGVTETVLVTGAAGFIGRWVVTELLDRGYVVRGLDDLSNGSRANVAAFADDPAFSLHVGDVTDDVTVVELFEEGKQEATACIHLAAEIDVHESLESPSEHFRTNVVGTRNVLEICRRTDTRLTLVGTCMVYNVASGTGGIDETHPVEPASPYAGTKLAGEELAMSYHHGYDLPVTVLRPFNTYGPYQKTGMAGGVVSIFVDRDRRDETLQIFGDGTQTRDLMYATDCARFVVDGTVSEAAVGEVINAGTGRDISINDLAELVATPGTGIEHVEHHHPQSEIERLRCDPGKAMELLGWQPQITLEEGVERLRRWLDTRQTEREV